MISRNKIKQRVKRKTNPSLADAISLGLKNKSWKEVAGILSGPTRRQVSINLKEIDENTKIGDTVLIPGKVLSKGEIGKKVRIVALSISEKAKAKLVKTKSEFATISEEISKNPKMEGIKILR